MEVLSITVQITAVFVAVVLLEVITEADSAVVLPITAVRSTVEAVPLAEAAMVPAVPLEVALPVARAIMAAVHSVAEDS